MIDYFSYQLLEKSNFQKDYLQLTWYDGQLRTSFGVFRYSA